MGYRSYVVYLELSHTGCWTESTGSKDVFVKNLQQDFSYSGDAYKAISVFVGDDLRTFLGPFKFHRNILGVKIHSLSNNIALVEFTSARNGTVADLVKRYGGVTISLEIVDGVERWRFLLPRARKESIGLLRDNAETMGNLLKFHVTEPEPTYFTDPYPLLSHYEDKALTQAYLSGYLDYPRRARAKNVAKILGISPATFLYHIRRAEKKLVASYLRRRSILVP
ncbi:MAG: helix-turn-helix domain-containing protein [Sulfolobales archaeon]